MKTLKTAWQNSIEFLVSNPWIFLLSIPIFYAVLPTPPAKPFLLQSFDKALPAEVQSQFNQSETEIVKILRSSGAAILLLLAVRLQHSNQLSTKG